MTSRRTVLGMGLASLGATRVASGLATGFALAGGLPRTALAAAHAEGHATANGGTITVHPVQHASLVMETPAGVIYADPVGGAQLYTGLPRADLIVVTHEHGDHYDADALAGLMGENTRLLTNPAVLDMLPGELRERAEAIGNGDTIELAGISIEAVPAYNLTEGRLQFHPEGRDNGYVMEIDGSRVYLAGDTEAVPQMRALENIRLAFVPMNLPYTMDIDQAADGVAEFAPETVYPYHHKGSDIAAFAERVKALDAAIEVVQANWYG